ncbi:hypothetical protein X925_08900 [Petrotoga sp. 9T1HF07.CasAA.8.2]|nr:hypothetical protein X925_08900 [Petrotoga sp. 9T1HF07.CasAA.8.2]
MEVLLYQSSVGESNYTEEMMLVKISHSNSFSSNTPMVFIMQHFSF